MANILAVAGPESKYQLPGAAPAGFWAGVWHGFIMAIALVVSLFNPGVRIYEKNNCGRFYDFGFLLGVCICFSGGPIQIGPLHFSW